MKLAFSIALLLVWGRSSAASDFWVTQYDDPVPGPCAVTGCTLREAVIAANATVATDRVFLSAGTYLLERAGMGENAAATGDLDITHSIEIIGPGATMTRVDGAGLDRVFHVQGTGTSARFAGITIQGGAVESPAGVLVAAGNGAVLEQVEVRDNVAFVGDIGGAITVHDGALTMMQSTVADNEPGGVSLQEGTTAEISNSTFDANVDSYQLDVIGSSNATCLQCTVKSVSMFEAVRVLSSSTLQIVNSIVAGGCLTGGGGGAMDSFGGNLESPGNTCAFDQGTDTTGVSSLQLGLGTLGDHGGPTRTRTTSPSSPARDGGQNAGCIGVDQRGLARPVDGDLIVGAVCDPGSVEASTEPPPTPLFIDGFEQRSVIAWSDWRLK